MADATIYCPLLYKKITPDLCLNITYATEGRISQAVVQEVKNWDKAKLICADCGQAYWNKNNMEVPYSYDEDESGS